MQRLKDQIAAITERAMQGELDFAEALTERVRLLGGLAEEIAVEQVIDILLAQPAAAEFVASKLYRFFVRDEVSPALQKSLGDLLRSHGYRIAPFLNTLFLSRDFYSSASMGAHIKSPVELVVSTYRRMGLQRVPGIPDFNDTTEAMGQKLLFPPNVAGWAGGRSWITPGLLLVRGNFVYDTVFPPIDFVPNDRVPASLYQIISVADRLARQLDEQGIELMLNAVNINLIAIWRYLEPRFEGTVRLDALPNDQAARRSRTRISARTLSTSTQA